MSDKLVQEINAAENEVNKNSKDQEGVKCTSSTEIKSDYVEESGLIDSNLSSGDDDMDNTENSDDEENERNFTEEEIELRCKQAFELKTRGNEEYKKEKYVDSIATYTEALHICPRKYKIERSILYANRAASYINIGNKTNAIQDCSKSLKLNETYVKAYLRRAKLYEELDKLDESLEDFKKVLDIDPGCSQAQIGCQRLGPKISEKNEKLKEDMLGKLKDLGNLVLRPFGLSTDNFKLEQNSETGGYSINFNQNREGT